MLVNTAEIYVVTPCVDVKTINVGHFASDMPRERGTNVGCSVNMFCLISNLAKLS